MSTLAKILMVTRQLYPQGRAFKMPPGSDLEKLHRGIGQAEADFVDDASSLFNSILPDNSEFTADDASDWERRLGIAGSSGATLADRKLAIKRKMAHPGDIKARQYYLYLEGQLRAAGFDVYVHENRFALYPEGYETQNPYDIYGPTGWEAWQHGDFQHGDFQHGSQYRDIVVNHLDVARDITFDFQNNLFNTFFIGGQTIGTFADVDEDRRIEFRQLVLRLKPAQTIAYLFVNYI